jgi:hypothetical protein
MIEIYSKRRLKKIGFMKRVAILISVLLAVAPNCSVVAQKTSVSGQGGSKTANMSGQASTANDQLRQVSLKVEEGDRIVLRNRFGPIIVTGVGGDTVEATASVIRQGTSDYRVRVATSRSGKDKIMISTSVTTYGQAQIEKGEYKESKGTGSAQGSVAGTARQNTTQSPGAPPPSSPRTPPPAAQGTGRPPRAAAPRAELTESSPPETLRGVGDIKLEVKLPRNAHIELIDSRRYALINSGTPSYLTNTRNDVSVTNMETPVSVISSGDVQIAKVGAIEVKTRAGNVQVKDISGPVSITTVMGAILIRDTDGDVRAVSISGPISVECAKGRTEASTTNGTITLTGIRGDLEAATTGGAISFTGAIRNDGRYRMKSMSGLVRMLIQREPPGFLASLSSYKGQILVDFDLKTELAANTATNDLPSTQRQPVRRVMGRYGSGDARITLDSFSGTVQLARAPSEVWKKCQ